MRNEIKKKKIARVQENGCKILLHLFNKREKTQHHFEIKFNITTLDFNILIYHCEYLF